MEIKNKNIKINIEKAKQGDQLAYTFLLDTYWNEVFLFMFKRTQNETISEDITIETFSKAFDKIKLYNDEFAFNTWLISIAKNVHIDLLRKKKSNIFIELDDEETQTTYKIADTSPTIEDELIQQQNLKQLLDWIKQLKPDYQEVIQLRYFQELSYQEISDQLQEPLSTIKVRLLRAKKLLADIIEANKQ
nr:RNA polymerase sigma factor [uncultured Flavobacterium sp.]